MPSIIFYIVFKAGILMGKTTSHGVVEEDNEGAESLSGEFGMFRKRMILAEQQFGD